MNKRIRKKKINHAITNIQTLLLKEDEFLIFRFDTEKWSPESMDNFSKYIKRVVSEKVMFVPKDIEMVKVKEEV